MVEPVLEETSDTVLTRSDIDPLDNKFEVTKEMAMAYAASFKDKADIVSFETYLYEEIPCLYIINYEDGWMVIPTDARAQAVLGESDVDNIVLEDLENDGVKAWLEVSAEYVCKIRTGWGGEYDDRNLQLWEELRNDLLGGDNLIGAHNPSDADWVRVTTVETNSSTLANQPHLLETKWGQGNPWNCTIPIDPFVDSLLHIQSHFPTGCVPTAVAQVLYYYHNETGYPNNFYTSISGFVSQSLGNIRYKIGINRTPQSPLPNSSRWSNMPLTASSPGDFSYVSDLMMEIGYRMNATYSNSATGASMVSYTDVAPCGITANSYYYSYDTVRSNINNRQPVLVSAFCGNTGHSWVIDGCVDTSVSTTITQTYYRNQTGTGVGYVIGGDEIVEYLTDEEVLAEYPNAYDGMSIVTNNTVQNKYLLMNFGYEGDYDDGHYGLIPSGNDWRGYTNTVCTIHNIVTGQLN
jgi:hypothetical protein